MTYAMLEKQLNLLPESSLEEVSRYVEYLVYKQQHPRQDQSGFDKYFGSITTLPEGMTFQRSVRDEWS